MKTKNIITALVVFSIVLIAGCVVDRSKDSQQSITTSGISILHAEKLAVLASSVFADTRQIVITSNQGLNPDTSIGGFPPGIMNGTIQLSEEMSNPAQLFLTKTFNDFDDHSSNDLVSLAEVICGITLVPGLYNSMSTLEITLGDASSIFIIQISTFTTIPERKTKLNSRTETSDIYWQVSCYASHGKTSVISGTVVIRESVNFDKGDILMNKTLAKNNHIPLEDINFFKK